MKFDILLKYREYLNETIKNRNTADRYYFAVLKLLKAEQFNSLEEITPEFLEAALSNIKTKNDFSAAKNGLKHLAEYDKQLKLPDDTFFKATSLKKRNWTKKEPKTIYLDTVQRKINALRNPKLKYGLRLMRLSGLRVSELSSLKKDDIKIDGDTITVNVQHGKGDKYGQVICDADPYLARSLTEYIRDTEEGLLFYTAGTMKKKAGQLGIECHDLRRIAAITHRQNLKAAGSTAAQANESTKEFLRHERFSTTKRYLFNRKLKFKIPLSLEQKQPKKKDVFRKFSPKEREIYNLALKNEPEITNMLQSLTEETGGHLEGLDYRLKSPDSVYEKAHGREELTAIEDMNDLIRYTGIYSSDSLAAATKKSLSLLQEKNYKIVKIKNSWDDKINPYKGINAVIRSPSGQTFEVQYHTQESFELKDGEMHRLYEQYRQLHPKSQKALKLLKTMFELSAKLQRPDNIDEVK
ncbi:tyrosine-type recombinase/integrase [Clostridium minihomine]|uniref:tyrosine-type recombinase/integrase n=1 Tax=Clostridium minihomine TaxID=2045012 RepID=UPI000C792C11|nr:site-specific integrase [Clostridium minihomine]